MPSWKKLIVSGSDASLNSLNVTQNVTAQSFTGSFSGSFTAPGATTQVVYNDSGVLAASSNFVFSGSRVGIGTANPVSLLNLNNGDAWINVESTLRGLQFGYGGSTHGSYRAAVMGGAESYGGSDSGMLTFHTQNGYVTSSIPPERMRITSVGNVGIGTTSPGAKLQIAGGTLDGASLTNLGISSGLTTGRLGTFDASSLASISTRGDASSVELAAGSSATYYSGISATANNATSFAGTLRFFTSGSEKVRIDASGNVGIGTTSPSQKLQVTDNTSFTSVNVHNAKGSAGGTSAIMLGLSDGAFITNDAARMEARIISNPNSALDFKVYGNSLNTIMTLLGTGNVGIGTTSPTAKLQVVLPANTNSSIFQSTASQALLNIQTFPTTDRMQLLVGDYNGTSSPNIGAISDSDTGIQWSGNNILRFVNGGSENVTINASGNVGVGTTAPSSKIHAVGSSTTELRLQNADANNNYGFIKYETSVASTGGNLIVGTNASGGGYGAMLFIADNNVDFIGGGDLRIVKSGNVGIGTYSPGYKLEVVGAVSASTYYGDGSNLTNISSGSVAAAGSDGQLQYNNNGNFGGATRLIYNDSTNRVGIGTANPGYDLDVSGSARIQDRLRVGPINSGNGVIHQSSDSVINASSATTVWSVPGSSGAVAFIEYYILNTVTGTSQRGGNIVVTWNAAGSPQIAHTETTTPDIGTTALVTFTTVITLGGDPQLIATNTSVNQFYIVLNYRYF